MQEGTYIQGASGKAPIKSYHLAAGNSLLKEGRRNIGLTSREVSCYDAAGTMASVESARNGYEAFQVLIVSKACDLKEITVQMTPLINSQTGRKISAKHVRLFLIKSVKTRGRKPDKYWPDILWPYEKFDLPKNQLQAIWVSIYIPKSAGAGNYQGLIEVHPADAPLKTIQVNLKIWDFALPDKTHLSTAFGFTTMDSMSRFYDFYPGSPQKQFIMISKYLRFLSDHRINTLFYGYVTNRDPRIVRIKEDKNGNLSYDFTKLDPYLSLLAELNMRFNIFAPSFWQNPESLFRLNPLLSRFKYLGRGIFNSPEFDRVVAQLLSSYVKHLSRKGWLKNAFCYVWDEPPDNMYDHMRKMCEMVKKVAPDIPRLTVANHEPIRLEGHCDIWCPNLGENSPPGCYDRYKDFYERRKKAGDEVWWYLACEPHPFPNWWLDYPLVDCRIPFWLTWRYGLDGVAYWNVNAWHYGTPETPHGDNFHEKVSERWPNRPWDPSWFCNCRSRPCQGNGQLIYPGPNGPVSSMRMESIRNGIEDYEYLRLLEQRSAALASRSSTAAHQKILQASKLILETARQAANRADDYERDAKKLLALRGKIGRQIEALTDALRNMKE